MSNEAFVTLATNDTYGLGALVLGRSLRRVATSKQTVVLITTDVSQKMKEELSQVFNLVVTVDTLDSGDAAHLALMSRPELGITFTKLHAWRLVQFSKCVFLDADTLVVQNCDELFEREELSAAPDPGWPDCFNSGVFVFVPSEATFKALIDFAVAHGSFDGGDQGLLNMFFSDWATGDIRKHLPFIYNVVSSATYSYLPALKHFGSQVKIAHFLGTNKPWMRQSQLGTSSPYQRAWWSIFREDVAGRLSQDMIVARPLTESSTTPILLPRYRFKDPWDFVRYENDGNRQHCPQTGQHHLNPDGRSQIILNRDEVQNYHVFKQSSPTVYDSFQSYKEKESLENNSLTPPRPKQSQAENLKHQSHNIDEENNTTVRSRTETEATEFYKNYLASTTIVKPLSSNNIIRDFPIQNAKETTYSNNDVKDKYRNQIKHIKDLNYKNIPTKEKSTHEVKVYHNTENNHTRNDQVHSFPIPEAVGTKIKEVHTKNMSNSLARTSEINEKLDKSDSATKISVQITRSDHFPECKISKNINSPNSVDEEEMSKVDSSITTANPCLKTECNKTIQVNTTEITITPENSSSKFEEQKSISNATAERHIPKSDIDLRSNCTSKPVRMGRIAKKTSQCNQTNNTPDKHHDHDKITYEITQQNSHKPIGAENHKHFNAGVAGVLARGEPDDWRREAWEAGDVDYLGQDSFDNIWKRICECVGITAQTLSAPAAPAATSAGIANQPSAPAPPAEKTEVTAPADNVAPPPTEKPSVTPPEKQTESVTSAPAEKQAEPEVLAQKQAEPVVSAEKPVEPAVPVEKPAEPEVPAQKQAEPLVFAEKPVEPAVPVKKPTEPEVPAQKQAEPVVSAEKPVEPKPSAEKPTKPTVPAEKPVEPTASVEKPLEPTAPAEKPAEPKAPAEKPAEPSAPVEKSVEAVTSAEKPAEPTVPAEKPVEPVVPAEKPTEPVVPTDKPAEPAVSAEKPVEPISSAEKPTESAVCSIKPSEPSVPSEKLAPVPEKVPEAAPDAAESKAVVEKEKIVELTPTTVKPSELPTAGEVPLEKPVAPAPAEKKSAKQEAPAVEKLPESDQKPATLAPETPTTTTVEKPEESAITLSKETKAVPSEKKLEAASEKPIETIPTGEKPTEKSTESAQETTAAEMCPLKPSKTKPPAPEPPVGISSQPASSEPSLKSGEARIQPPAVGEEAPVSKQEPSTPTVTPPSGPGSPQPADVPPEVCKLQATPSQPATPPASSHQTSDAPVPPKRKQGKNGKSGKGKK